MKNVLFLFLLISFGAQAQKAPQADTVTITLNQVELVKFGKLYKISDSVAIEVNKKLISKLNDKGIDEANVVGVVPSNRRDVYKFLVKKSAK